MVELESVQSMSVAVGVVDGGEMELGNLDMSWESCTRLLDLRLILRREKRRGIEFDAATAAAATVLVEFGVVEPFGLWLLGARLPENLSGVGGTGRRNMSDDGDGELCWAVTDDMCERGRGVGYVQDGPRWLNTEDRVEHGGGRARRRSNTEIRSNTRRRKGDGLGRWSGRATKRWTAKVRRPAGGCG